MTNYFTSDLHLSHARILEICPNRQQYASTVEEHNQVIIDNYNSLVQPDDPYDVILKPTAINLEDYLDKPELLQLRNETGIIALYPYNYPNSYFAVYEASEGKCNYVVHDSTGLKFNDGSLDGFDLILKTPPEPAEQVDKLAEVRNFEVEKAKEVQLKKIVKLEKDLQEKDK